MPVDAPKPLVRRFFEAVGIRIAVMASGLGISVFLARMLSLGEVGEYVFAVSVVTILSIPVQAGLPMLLTKTLPKYQVAEDPARVKGVLVFSLLFTLSFSGLAFLTYWAFDYWLHWQVGTYSGRHVVHLAILLMPFIALSTVVGAAIRGLGKLLIGQLIETGSRQFILFAMLGAAAIGATGATISAEKVMLFHIAAAVATLFVGTTILILGCGLREAPVGWRVDWRLWIKMMLPLSLIAGLQIIFGKSDVLMLRGIAGAEAVGIYFIANQVGNLVFLTNQAVLMVNGPALARAAQRADVAEMQYIYSRGALFVFLSAIPPAAVLLLFGEAILELVFGADFRTAYPVVVVFSIGYVVQALFGSTELLLKITDHEWVAMRAIVFAIAANLTLNALMIPWLGALGAALASIGVTLALKLHLSREIQTRVGISAFAFGPLVAHNPHQ